MKYWKFSYSHQYENKVKITKYQKYSNIHTYTSKSSISLKYYSETDFKKQFDASLSPSLSSSSTTTDPRRLSPRLLPSSPSTSMLLFHLRYPCATSPPPPTKTFNLDFLGQPLSFSICISRPRVFLFILFLEFVARNFCGSFMNKRQEFLFENFFFLLVRFRFRNQGFWISLACSVIFRGIWVRLGSVCRCS